MDLRVEPVLEAPLPWQLVSSGASHCDLEHHSQQGHRKRNR